MGIDYSGVNPATDLGLDQWSTGEIGQISQVVDDLKNHQPVTLADLDRSTILAARGLGHDADFLLRIRRWGWRFSSQSCGRADVDNRAMMEAAT